MASQRHQSAWLTLVAVSLLACINLPSCAAITYVDVIQFALNLEYLEANFYSCAAFGVPINSSLWGTGPAPSGCKAAKLSKRTMEVAMSIALDEIAHVVLLRGALQAAGVPPVPQPAINIGTAFSAAFNAAAGGTVTPAFSPYTDDISFLLGAYLFEDVGATAYLGALPIFASTSYLGVAGALTGVESYHAGAIRALLFEKHREMVYPGVAAGKATTLISAVRNAVANTTIDTGLLIKNVLNLVPDVGNSGLIYTRTPAEVLSIVYLGGTQSGGFFPQGTNGAINSTVA